MSTRSKERARQGDKGSNGSGGKETKENIKGQTTKTVAREADKARKDASDGIIAHQVRRERRRGNTRQDSRRDDTARQKKARQDKTRSDKRRQYKRVQEKPRQATQDKKRHTTRQDKMRQRFFFGFEETQMLNGHYVSRPPSPFSSLFLFSLITTQNSSYARPIFLCSYWFFFLPFFDFWMVFCCQFFVLMSVSLVSFVYVSFFLVCCRQLVCCWRKLAVK